MWECLIGMLFYNSIVLWLNIESIKYGDKRIPKVQFFWIIFVFILYGTYGPQFGDYPHYKELVEDIYKQYLSYSGPEWYKYLHMERQYNFLVVFCNGNYYLWRFLIWGALFSFLGYVFSIIGLDNYNGLKHFTLFALFSLTGGRVSWGVAFFFGGLYTFLYTREKKYLIFTALSFFAHTSMILLLALLPLMFVRINKLTVLLIILVIPSLGILFGDTIEYFMELQDAENALSQKAMQYSGEFSSGFMGESIGETIQKSLEKLPPFILILHTLYIYVIKKKEMPLFCLKYYSLIIALFTFTVAALSSKYASGSFAERYLYMIYFPLFLFLYHGTSENKKSILFKFSCVILWLSLNANFLKSAYYYSVQGV